MQTLSQKFLSKEEKDRVSQKVKEAEILTSGEIVPLIVSASFTYPKARILASLFYSVPIAFLFCHLLAIFYWIDPENIYLFLAIQIPLFFLAHQFIIIFPYLAKPFISKNDMENEVKEEATTSFFNEGLYKTKEANGILLFISVFESKVWILADSGIQEKLEENTWQEIIGGLTDRISSETRCDALCEAIEKIGVVLQNHFPHKRDDTDELHNLIIR